MKVRGWVFPTFEEWQENNHDWKDSIGVFNCSIDIFSFDPTEAVYMLAISTHDTPSNIYAHKIAQYCKTIEYENEEGLRNWYNIITQDVQRIWTQYIWYTFLEEGTSHG